ncbi:MAG: hypothetical protein J6D27_09585 [Ruminiclostridium sp.]|nr:hypothetical protein [Ruminiclostridium sp.]
MTDFELLFYNAGIEDVREAGCITLACKSQRYNELSRKLRVKIGDERGDSSKAYSMGVAHEINRQTKLGIEEDMEL